VTIEPNGKDLANGRRLARPVRSDRPRGVRARTAHQHRVRVPERRWAKDVDLEGPWRRSPHDRRGRAARAAPVPVPSTATEPRHRLRSEGTDAIPRLFDEFDKFAAATAGREVRGELPPGYAATFRYSLVDPAADVAVEADAYRPPFAHLAMLIQVPGVDVLGQVEREKGSALTDHEHALLDRRAVAARAWLDTYAPGSAVLLIKMDAVPASAAELDMAQRRFLARLGERAAREEPASGDAWQTLIFSVATDEGVPGKRAFEAIYRAFLDRTNGPRAGWLLASLDPAFVIGRAAEAGGLAGAVQ
jgi:lysyl-tRNA synthetase class I